LDATRITEPEKQAFWNAEHLRQQTAAAVTPIGRGTPYRPPVDFTPRSLPTGIRPDGNPIGGMIFNNSWYGVLQGQRIAVRAGWIQSSGLGVIAVEYSSEAPRNNISAPAGIGKLRLVSEVGGVFTVIAESGETFLFDVENLALSSPTPAVSPGTPEPIATIGVD
jgi:hypothetical protein